MISLGLISCGLTGELEPPFWEISASSQITVSAGITKDLLVMREAVSTLGVAAAVESEKIVLKFAVSSVLVQTVYNKAESNLIKYVWPQDSSLAKVTYSKEQKVTAIWTQESAIENTWQNTRSLK